MGQSDKELLIRIDERQKIMEKDINHITLWIEDNPLKVQEVRVKFLERIVWGALIASMLATVKSFWKGF